MTKTVLAANIAALRKSLGLNQAGFADRLGVGQPYVSKWERGVEPSGERLATMAEWAGVPARSFSREPWVGARSEMSRLVQPNDDIETVGIQNINQAFGLGATFTETHVEIDVLPFPKVWVDSITSTNPAFLTWTRGRGDSMAPTIHDGDLVLLDRSQQKVKEQDALWAYTIGDTGSIKRLRVKGDRFVIMSDNPLISDDEEPIDFVNIVARVIFVGAKK